MLHGLKATIQVLKNASGLDSKVVAHALGRALSAAKRTPGKPVQSDLGGHKLELAWSPVTGSREMLMIFLQARP